MAAILLIMLVVLCLLVVMDLIGAQGATFPSRKPIMDCMLVVTDYQESVANFNFTMAEWYRASVCGIELRSTA